MCGLENEQLRKLISPAEEVLEDIVEDDRFPEGFIDIYNAIDESGVVTALSETQVFIFELLSLSGTEDGGNPLSGALSKYLCEYPVYNVYCSFIRILTKYRTVLV